MKSILLIGLALTIGSVLLYSQPGEEPVAKVSFKEWKQLYGRSYSELEEAYRLQVYLQNHLLIQLHNQDSTQSYEMGPNQFMDLTSEEFHAKYLSQHVQQQYFNSNQTHTEPKLDLNNIPNGVDWRNYTKVKEQGQCASGWAFSVTGSIEAFYYIRGGGQIIDLSEQQLVDCEVYSRGCQGGFTNTSFSYAQYYGLQNRTAYPYVARNQTCRTNGGPYKVNGYQAVSGEAYLKAALANLPVTVGVDAANWQFYKSGVFNNCQKQLNHFVLNVGYQDNGTWILKNSWGLTWGEQGHIRLSPGDTCGVTYNAYQNI